eukprot:TRINITY_DN18826_c0_g1_i4.p1 TRINITY_DN18826_c0_g1~~TRINITY_DN18826_c0_g1_i4.p1  ORF type:complete len:533 (-),score=40.86 TRINITY_DN18826_c0_g1_i4:175-1773(-)
MPDVQPRYVQHASLVFADAHEEARYLHITFHEQFVNLRRAGLACTLVVGCFLVDGLVSCWPSHRCRNPIDWVNSTHLVLSGLVGIFGIVLGYSQRLLFWRPTPGEVDVLCSSFFVLLTASICFGSGYFATKATAGNHDGNDDSITVFVLHVYLQVSHFVLSLRWRSLVPMELCCCLFYGISVVSCNRNIDDTRFGAQKGCMLLVNVIFYSAAKRSLERYQRATYEAFETQKVLLQEAKCERETTSALLNTVCTATFWLQCDGDTVSCVPDHRLEELLGCNMEGCSLSSKAVQGEQDRLLHAIQGTAKGRGDPLTILPATLSRSDAALVQVDVVVAHRPREGRDDVGEERAYLVGLLQQHDYRCDRMGDLVPTDVFTEDVPKRRRRQQLADDAISVDSDGPSRVSFNSSAVSSELRQHFYLGKAYGLASKASGERFEKQVQRMFYKLVSSGNFQEHGCCRWHATVEHYGRLLEAMKQWRTCKDAWPCLSEEEALRQCSGCTAVHDAKHSEEDCWLCGGLLDPLGHDASSRFAL